MNAGHGHSSLLLTATNMADDAAPLGFGHHPYHDAAGAKLCFTADHLYPNAPDGLPTTAETPTGHYDFSAGRIVEGTAIDNLYGGWAGSAQICWPGRRYALHMASTLPHAVLYTPPGEGYFCFEPVPHLTNALNRADGDMPLIAPQGMYRAEIRYTAVPPN
jgi:aldose 1-epimerase